MTDFNLPIDLKKGYIKTKFKGKELILKNIYLYDGAVTMQYLPYGGIQSVYDYTIILNCVNGFIASKEVIYDHIEMSSKDFILMFDNIVNEVLPN